MEMIIDQYADLRGK